MQVTSNELNAIKMIALSQANLTKLGEFSGKSEIVGQIKKAKTVWWKTMRMRYGLDTAKGSQRLSIELDGDKAGELRYKAQNEADKADVTRRAVQPRQQAEAQATPQGNGSSGNAAEVAKGIVAALGSVLEAAGLEVRVKDPGNSNEARRSSPGNGEYRP